jgi:MFS family permease
MHGFNDQPTTAANDPADSRPWYQLLNRYQWFVLAVAALGWMFDCLDQQLFILARPSAMEALVKDPAQRSSYGNLSTTIFMLGWACGGLFFGVLGDRIGRAKTMLITILLYSLFTGLSALSTGFADFALYRFLTGLGVGGEFAVGVALVAEVMPGRARPYTLGLLQALSAIGNVSAAMINLGLGVAEEAGLVDTPWRIMFVIGALPALLALVIRARLKEPEAWQKASHRELLGDPVLRKRAVLGLILGCSGIIGLWSVGFFTPDLIRTVQRKRVSAQVYLEQISKAREEKNDDRAHVLNILLDQQAGPKSSVPVSTSEVESLRTELKPIIDGRLSRWSSYTSLMINLGAALGMFGFGALSQRIGRKPTFAMAFVAAFLSSVSVFWFLDEFWQIFVMVPVMGFCQLSLFAGYAIYFPELFPTRLRSTGTSFCYNVGRFLAAFGPLVKTQLEVVFKDTPEPLRYAGVAMSGVFLVGLFVLPFLPETKGEPLPE